MRAAKAGGGAAVARGVQTARGPRGQSYWEDEERSRGSRENLRAYLALAGHGLEAPAVDAVEGRQADGLVGLVAAELAAAEAAQATAVLAVVDGESDATAADAQGALGAGPAVLGLGGLEAVHALKVLRRGLELEGGVGVVGMEAGLRADGERGG